MNARTLSSFFSLAICTLVCAADETGRLPRGANAVVTVDVTRVMDSEYAKSNDWQQKLIQNSYDRPLGIAANATRITTAAMLDLDSLTPRWQASLIEAAGQLNCERVAARAKGYVDRIAGKDVVVMPNGTYYTQRGPGMIGAFWPAQRQAVSRWLTHSDGQGGLTETLAAGVQSDAPYVIFLDTTDAYAPAGIFHAIRDGGFPSLDKFDGDVAKVVEALGSMKSIRFAARFATGIQGEVVVDFGSDVELVGPYAKALATDALAEAGLGSESVKNWSFTAKGKQITGTGPVSAEMLAFLGTLFSPPTPPVTLTSEASQANLQASENSAAQASAAYFKAVTRIVDNINFSQASLKQTGQYLRNQALTIERLPVLNVDPVLQDWGTKVAEAFNRSAQICLTGQSQAIASVESVASPTARTRYGTGYDSTATAESRAEFRNAQMQRREAGASQRTQTLDAVTTLLNAAIGPRGDLKKQLTQKYQIEF